MEILWSVVDEGMYRLDKARRIRCSIIAVGTKNYASNDDESKNFRSSE